MCSIVGSFDKDKLIELCKMNEYRGVMSHSISYFDWHYGTGERFEGSVNYDSIEINPYEYCLVHMQAPTAVGNNIHPAENDTCQLWHNGIIKESSIKYLNDKYDLNETWDTELLLQLIIKNGFNVLSDVDGSFSCALWFKLRKSMILFRNEIAPMFVDDYFNISSTNFEGASPIPPNQVFEFDPWNSKMDPISAFTTKNNPYYFGE